MPRTTTRTYTVTSTRLETIEDQFRHFLTFGEVKEQTIKRILQGVSAQWIEAVGLYGCNEQGERVVEVELHVDWSLHGDLRITHPSIATGMSGWSGSMSPEVKVAGRRFAELVSRLGAKRFSWVRWTPEVREDVDLLAKVRSTLGYGNGESVPRWSSEAEERHDQLFDVPELQITVRSVED